MSCWRFQPLWLQYEVLDLPDERPYQANDHQDADRASKAGVEPALTFVGQLNRHSEQVKVLDNPPKSFAKLPHLMFYS